VSRTVQQDAASRQGSPAALVAALFGMSGRSAMPGPALVALLGDLGLAAPAARRALARMREQRQLVTTPRGRRVDHHLVGAFRASVERLRDDRGEPPPWDGSFHTLMHHVPESARPYRDRLRRTAVLVGYAPWQPGVLISPVDRSASLAEVIAAAPPGASVVLGRLAIDGGVTDGGVTDGGVTDGGSAPAAHDHRDDEDPDGGRPGPRRPDDHGDARRPATAIAAAMARRAWDLDALAADLRAHLPELDAALEAPALEAGPDVLRRIVHLTNAVFLDLLRDPGLPRELRPPDWPGDELRVLIGRIAAADGPAAVAHIAHRCDTAT
jgi:phenylacetic acid degradation operon negative regulatory protein